MRKSFKIITLGCKVNQYESTSLNSKLLSSGWTQATSKEKADVAIVNTCIVTRTAARQSRQAIRRAIRDNPGGIIAATGCYGQVFSNELLEIKGLTIITGNTKKGHLLELLKTANRESGPVAYVEDFHKNTSFESLQLGGPQERARGYLKIQDGCESFCSYCIVPFSRGPCRSMPRNEVLNGLESLAKAGLKEIVLTGIHLGKYGSDLEGGRNLYDLLKDILAEDFPLRIRLSSMEPNEIDMDLIELMATETKLCRHFHIPLQSGDDEILISMNRHYKRKDFVHLIEEIRTSIPLAGIGVDVLTGFPGEDRAAHSNTVSLIKDMPLSYLHVFPFSPRRGTPAATFDDRNSPQTIKGRAAELRKMGLMKKEAFFRSCLNHSFEVLSEEWHSEELRIAKGTSDNYLPVLFSPAPFKKNSMVEVKIENVEGDFVVGSSFY
jgi:threonylcarbamoyladenosine tRNA methylthiotransferase MtaB